MLFAAWRQTHASPPRFSLRSQRPQPTSCSSRAPRCPRVRRPPPYPFSACCLTRHCTNAAAFERVRKFGTVVPFCRHPAVLAHVSAVCSAAVPLLAAGTACGFALVLVTDREEVVESHCVTFSGLPPAMDDDDAEADAVDPDAAEEAFRGFLVRLAVLDTSFLPRRRSPAPPDTFKLLVIAPKPPAAAAAAAAAAAGPEWTKWPSSEAVPTDSPRQAATAARSASVPGVCERLEILLHV